MVVTKLERRPAARWRRRTGRSAIIVLLVLVLGSVGISGYVGWSLSHPAKQALSTTPESVGIPFKSIEFPSRKKDVTLKGWELTPAGDPAGTVIFSHGYTKNRLQDDVPALPLAKSLVDAGYRVVMFDYRNSGESGGNLTSVGQFEKFDLLGAIDWAKANAPGKIDIVGFSMGATTALLAAAEEPSVSHVIADSPFNHLKVYLEDNLSVWSHLPEFPFTPLIMAMIPPVTGIDPDQVDALSAVDALASRHVLFIHSADDNKIPYTNSEAMWAKHKNTFEFWKTSGALHVGSYKTYGKQYEEKVLTFLQK
ncbi:alpha/beta hydrolase [Paenibacillus sp. MBLB4367]|uniref:alpha/beta hydrolase n=1 Tax=Paenibacillus sp. MBLB4367 TaxID=3384767 RepID=UPI003907FF13